MCLSVPIPVPLPVCVCLSDCLSVCVFLSGRMSWQCMTHELFTWQCNPDATGTPSVANTTIMAAKASHRVIRAHTAIFVQDALAHFSAASWLETAGSQAELDKIFPMKTSKVRLVPTTA